MHAKAEGLPNPVTSSAPDPHSTLHERGITAWQRGFKKKWREASMTTRKRTRKGEKKIKMQGHDDGQSQNKKKWIRYRGKTRGLELLLLLYAPLMLHFLAIRNPPLKTSFPFWHFDSL